MQKGEDRAVIGGLLEQMRVDGMCSIGNTGMSCVIEVMEREQLWDEISGELLNMS